VKRLPEFPVSRPDGRVAVVVATRDRLTSLRTTLRHLLCLPERPRVLVVDNSSADGTPQAVSAGHPGVEVISLSENLGAGARTLGASRLDVPYVAFSDDDSWWEPGSLARAADILDAFPRLGLVAGRVLLGPERTVDPTCAEMAASPLGSDDELPGPRILGFVACGAIVRRSAFLQVGGFDPRFGVGGEEKLLAIDLAAADWALAYVDDVVAHHHPSPSRNPARRRRTVTRNDLWSAWLRRPPLRVVAETARLLRPGLRDRSIRAGALDALHGLGWVARERRVVPPHLESQLRLLEC
jgi:GT2 family glycosyltransferase